MGTFIEKYNKKPRGIISVITYLGFMVIAKSKSQNSSRPEKAVAAVEVAAEQLLLASDIGILGLRV